jgi:hypothetical protein
MVGDEHHLHHRHMHRSRAKENTMNRRRAAVGALALAAFIALPATTAAANEPNNGRSFCANSGPPEGEFAGDIYDTSTYGNAGEVVAWFSQQAINPGPGGQTVKAFCEPVIP